MNDLKKNEEALKGGGKAFKGNRQALKVRIHVSLRTS